MIDAAYIRILAGYKPALPLCTMMRIGFFSPFFYSHINTTRFECRIECAFLTGPGKISLYVNTPYDKL